jgi:hypothetical protein
VQESAGSGQSARNGLSAGMEGEPRRSRVFSARLCKAALAFTVQLYFEHCILTHV